MKHAHTTAVYRHPNLSTYRQMDEDCQHHSQSNQPAAIIYDPQEGALTLSYMQHGSYHREDGPAYIATNVAQWWVMGSLKAEYRHGKWTIGGPLSPEVGRSRPRAGDAT